MIVGKNIPVNEINMAVCCESVDEEINNPNARQVSVNKILSKLSNNQTSINRNIQNKYA